MTQITQVRKPFNLILFISLGIIFWFEALLFIRFWGNSLFINGNPWLLLVFIASIPIVWISLKVSVKVGRIDGENLLNAVAIMTLTASCLDSIALAWFQGWYGLMPTELLLAAAWLLWGIGISLGIGYWASRQ